MMILVDAELGARAASLTVASNDARRDGTQVTV